MVVNKILDPPKGTQEVHVEVSLKEGDDHVMEEVPQDVPIQESGEDFRQEVPHEVSIQESNDQFFTYNFEIVITPKKKRITLKKTKVFQKKKTSSSQA